MSVNNVKTIDFRSENSSNEIIDSLRFTGFAILRNHGIDKELINKVYIEWSSFFNSNDKYEYLYHSEKQDGYFPMKSENAKGYNIKDLKEFYHIYLPWGRVPNTISNNTLKLRQKLKEIGAQILKYLDNYTPEKIKSTFSMPLNEMIDKSHNNLLRIIHYPPLEGDEEKGAIRAAPHEDINLITVLLTGSSSGLQILNRSNEWINVESNPGWIVVNVGDMLQECSQKYYPSTTHRVINPKTNNVSRYSMPLFLHPRDEVSLSDRYTAKSYLEERLKQLGLK